MNDFSNEDSRDLNDGIVWGRTVGLVDARRIQRATLGGDLLQIHLLGKLQFSLGLKL